MGLQAIDYKAVIDDLERKRGMMNARFDAAIAALRQVIALEGSDIQPPLPGVSFSETHRVTRAPYAGMSMIDAAIKHIGSVGHAVPNVQLAKDLEAGGYAHKSKNFANTLNSILWRRAKTTRDIRKSARGWELVGE